MAASPSFEWFGLVEDDSLEQGDFFFPCTVISGVSEIAGETELTIQAQANDYDVVVMSQSCDLAHDKPEPHWSARRGPYLNSPG